MNTFSINNLSSDAIKLALAGNEGKSQLQKKVHGVNSTEYNQIREKIWTRQNALADLLPLWEEDTKYLDATLTFAIENKQKLLELVAIIQKSGNPLLQQHLITRLEDNRNALSKAIRSITNDQLDYLQDALSLLSVSKLLQKDIVDVLYALGSKLPTLLKGLQLGEKTVEAHLAELAANPIELRHKVLKTLGIRPDGHKVIKEKQLGLILGDAYISGSGLEGYVFSEAFELVRCFHEALTPEICQELDAMQTFAKILSSKNPEQVFPLVAQELQKNGRVATPCGWVAHKSGHAMVAECRLEPNGTATVRLYNKGAGLQYHNAQNSGFRERRGAYIEKRNIPQQLVTSSAFWLILLGPQWQLYRTEPLGEEDIYSWFIHCIPGTLVDAEQMILPQRSGSCAFKSILAYLKGRMLEEAYDNFILKFKIGTLVRYEEDLFLRKSSLNTTEERFLTEIRQKLTQSTLAQAKIGRISDETKNLLLSYLSTPLQLSGDKGITPTVCQLRSRFKIQSKELQQDQIVTVTEHNHRSANNAYLALPINREEKKIDDFASWLLHVLHKSPNELQFYLHKLPPLATLANEFAKSKKNDMKTMLQALITKQLQNPQNQILVAWLTEAYVLLTESMLKPQIGIFSLSAEPKCHPLERANSPLKKERRLLSVQEERLLQEWRTHRYNIRNTPRLYKSGMKQGTLFHLITPESSLTNRTLPNELLDLMQFRTKLEYQLQSNWPLPYPKNSNTLYHKERALTEVNVYRPVQQPQVLPIMPFVGIDRQLTEMEQDIEKIALFAPETSWAALSFADDSTLAVEDDPKLGFSPLSALRDPQNVTSRLKRLTERLLIEHPTRIDLAEILLKLVSRINHRVPAEHAIVLDLPSDYPKELDAAVTYYKLTLPEGKITADERAAAHALGKIILGHTQAPSSLQRVVDADQKVSLECWNALCARYAKEGVEIGINGAPYVRNIFQIPTNTWTEIRHASVLQELFPDAAFGPWHLVDTKLIPEPTIGTIFRCKTTGAIVLRAKNYRPFTQGDNLLLTNKTTLALRLAKLGLDMPSDLDDEALYELFDTSLIDGLPNSLLKEHIELWYPRVVAATRKGLIVDSKQRLAYLVEGNKSSLRIVNLATEAELLTGKLKPSPNMLFTWHGTKVEIPYLGKIVTNDTIPVEVWAKGRNKSFELWFSCMDGAINFYVQPNKNGTISYESLDYPGFYWQPNKTVSEFGMLNGILLTHANGTEELLIIAEQHLVSEKQQPWRNVWQSNTNKGPIIFRRALHPDLAHEDVNQRLFATDTPAHYGYLIQELMLQRNWDRAKRYVELIMPAVGQASDFTPNITLSHPKAVVLSLRIVAKTDSLNDLDAKVYKKYIDQYHLLEPGWALERHEELKLAKWLDPDQRDLQIQNHLRRIDQYEPKSGHSYEPTKSEFVASKSAKPLEFSNNPPWDIDIFRPLLQKERFDELVNTLTRQNNADSALLEAALVWYAARNDKSLQKSLLPAINHALKNCTRPNQITVHITALLKDICKKAPSGQTQALPPLPYSQQQIASFPKYTMRQNERQLALKALRSAQSQIWFDIGKELANCSLTYTKAPKSHFTSLEQLYKNPQGLLKELKRIYEQSEKIHAQQITALKPLKMDLGTLFTWLETFNISGPEELLGLVTASETKQNEAIALSLVQLAQTRGELTVLKNTIKLLEQDNAPSAETLSRSLAIASIVEEEMPFTLRVKLASFMWRKELAFRPNQLQVILHTHNVKGLLAQADCGDGKTFAISPGIGAIADNLIVNVVPPGIFDTHSRELSLDLETNSGQIAYPLTLTRHDIWKMLPKMHRWLEEARRDKTPIVTTVSDLASVVLAYFDMLLAPKDAPQKAHRALLESIRRTFKKKSTLLLDEVDTAAKEQVHWTMGDRVSIAEERQNMIAAVYEALATIDSQHESSLFCLDGKKRFSPARYHSEALHLLVSHIIEKGIFSQLDHIDRKWLQQYLTCEPGTKGIVLPEEQQEFLMMLRAELTVYLPHTLAMRYKVEYGPGQHAGSSAIPYKAAQVPDPKSRFTLFDILANLTLQMAIREGPTDDMVHTMAQKLLYVSPDKAKHYVKRWLGQDGSISDLRAIVEKKGQWRKAVANIKENTLARLDIAAALVLPKIELYTHTMQFSVASLEQAFGTILGLTATPYNRAGMDERLANNFLATDAYETTKQKLATSKTQIYTLLDDDTVRQIAASEGVFALMDPSAWLVDYPNKKVAELILSGARQAIEYVLFWDVADGAWRALGRRGFIEVYDKKKHTKDKTFIHFDQARSRGIDMPLPDDCSAVVLVGHDCTLTDLKQASERLRQLKTGKQSVILWSTESNILERVEHNELKQLVDELPIMAKRQMFERVRTRLLERDEAGLIAHYKELLLQEVDHKSFKKHASLDASPTVRQELDAYHAMLLTTYPFLTADDVAALDGIKARCLEALKNAQDNVYKPSLDMRAEIILTEEAYNRERSYDVDIKAEAQSQQKVTTQVQTLEANLTTQKQVPFNAKELLTALNVSGFFGTNELGGMTLARINCRFRRLEAPNTLWISTKTAPYSEDELQNSPLKRDLWKRIDQCAYILIASNGALFVSGHEADCIVKELHQSTYPNIQLIRLDGTDFCTGTATQNIPLLQIASIFNGSLGPLTASTFGQPSPSASRLSFLKDRLAHLVESDPLHYSNNPLVHLLESNK